jgi:hypothetical protein
MSETMIYCCACQADVAARLTDGKEIYPHRNDLFSLPFWKCDTCKNYVGCHHKTQDRTKPLGNIPSPEIKKARQYIHALLDPIWRTGRMSRDKVYMLLSEKLGYPYHTGEIRTIDDARKVYITLKEIAT